MERVTNGEALLKTVSSNLNGLLNYAKFLESRGLQWFEFPSRKADRCLVQYRGALIKGSLENSEKSYAKVFRPAVAA